MYKLLLRPLLFLLDPEFSHQLTFFILKFLHLIPGIGALLRFLYARRTPTLPVEIMGLQFANPICLAAGLDKNGEYIKPLAALGFAGIEVGTVTPRAQSGNPRKRLFRIPSHRALINRMGFNSLGTDKVLHNLGKYGKPCIIGANIGKNLDTPVEQVSQDYIYNLRAMYGRADYIVVNISSPNTPGLRELQEQTPLGNLLQALKTEQIALTKTRGVYVPIALKIAPDLSDEQIADIADKALEHKLDAIIATNTTLTRPGMENVLLAQEAGGLSGLPLKDMSTSVIRKLYGHLQGKIPIIGVGGVTTANDAWEKLVAGADLLQIYTSLIYQGPGVVKAIVKGLIRRVNVSGEMTLAGALAKARTGMHLMR